MTGRPFEATSLESQELEELDFDIPCRVATFRYVDLRFFRIPLSKPRPCPNVADYLATCTSCYHRSFMCALHREQLEAEGHMTCAYCLAEGPTGEMLMFIRLVTS